MRLVTLLNDALNSLNALLLFTVAGPSLWLWSVDAVTAGALAVTVGLVLRLQGMSHWIMWEVAGLFENVGTVQDGIETIARERSVVDAPDAKPLEGAAGRDQLRARPLQLRARCEHGARQRHRRPDACASRRARRSASSAARAPASRRWSTCCCASTTSTAAAS